LEDPNTGEGKRIERRKKKIYGKNGGPLKGGGGIKGKGPNKLKIDLREEGAIGENYILRGSLGNEVSRGGCLGDARGGSL